MTRYAALFLLPLTVGCLVTKGDGTIDTRTFELSGFNAVRIGSGVQATYKIGEPSVSMTADSNLFEEFEVKVEDGVLVVRNDHFWSSLHPTRPVELAISAPTLVSAEMSGSSLLAADRVEAGVAFFCEASGASEVRIGTVVAGTLDLSASGASTLVLPVVSADDLLVLSLSGASSATVEGSAGMVDLTASGGSHVEAAKLLAQRVNVDLSGGSEATLNVNEVLSGSASGGSKIQWTGPGRGGVDASGDSQVSRL